MPDAPVQAFDYVLPIFAGPDAASPTAIVGSAFCIGSGRYITAAHCLREGMQVGWMGVGRPGDGNWRVWQITRWEVIEGCDVGVFQAAIPPPAPCFPWSLAELALADPVKSVGYDHGLDAEHRAAVLRAFVGHIVSSGRPFEGLVGRPRIHEVSFRCPRGLSGAPLIARVDQVPSVVGVMIANTSTDMPVLDDQAVATDAPSVRHESFSLGIALRCDAILDLRGWTLLEGETIGDHLKTLGPSHSRTTGTTSA
jgi:hypothetical protein